MALGPSEMHRIDSGCAKEPDDGVKYRQAWRETGNWTTCAITAGDDVSFDFVMAMLLGGEFGLGCYTVRDAIAANMDTHTYTYTDTDSSTPGLE